VLKNELVTPLTEQNREQQVRLDELNDVMQRQRDEHQQEIQQLEKKMQRATKLAKQKGDDVEELKGKVTQLQKQLEEEQGKLQCVICFERKRDTIVLPCMHFLTCYQCLGSLSSNRCPHCRSNIQGKLQCILHT
jgi:hypothetical protein